MQINTSTYSANKCYNNFCFSDGTNACGLFVAMCFIIDKIKMEQVCDVCLAVNTVRHSRKEFVRKAEQFAFLYTCALEYVGQFEMYSNFKNF